MFIYNIVLLLSYLTSFIIIVGTFTIIGSLFDYGHRDDGNVRNDIPSTIGFLLGCILYLHLLYI